MSQHAGALVLTEAQVAAVRLWLEFSAGPTGRNWYRAHNASIVAAYLEHRALAEAESAPERFFMNVALGRVLYAHALVAASRLALGRLAPLGRLVGDPRLGGAGVFLSLKRVLPNRYPLNRDVERYIAQEQRVGRLLDSAVIVPRLQVCTSGQPTSSPNRACSSWFATATRSTSGPSRSDTCGALGRCRSQPASLRGSHAH
jgi:hypothetical protein